MVPDEWRQRAPRLSERAYTGLMSVLQHADAPRWNRTMGDRVGDAELEGLAAFRRELAEPFGASREPSARVLGLVDSWRGRLPVLDDLPYGFDLARDFEELPTTGREDIAVRIEALVPRDAD